MTFRTLWIPVLLFIVISSPAAAARDYQPQPDPNAVAPALSAPVIVVPSPDLPAEVSTRNSNNNLDVVRHDGRVFLAFRTAPSHFASDKTDLFIVSSTDQQKWDFEAKFNRATDLREPRFLSYDGKLFLYFAVLGANQFDFAPQGMMVTQYQSPGRWTEPRWFLDKGFIPWRTKVIDGKPYMLAYRGGENLYDFEEGSSEELNFLTTENGIDWTAVAPGRPVVYKGGCSETDFAFAPDGAAIAVCRNELGDKQGFGSKVCRAEPGALADWTCNPDPKKYDSPLVFAHNGEIYLVGRRNLSKSGAYDLGQDKLPYKNKLMMYQVDYWKRPKRCSLWRVDPRELKVTFIQDLPGRGDTCFASIVPMDGNSYMLYNYTSPLDGEDVSWNQGQQGKTLIYRLLLTFPK